MDAIQLVGIEKAYGRFRPRPALRSVTLRVARGECFGLAGPNGAGKTTLIRILLGLTTPDAGEVRLFGLDPTLPEVRRRVGFVPEAAELPHGATPLDLVARWARLRGLVLAAARSEGEHQLVRLGMKELLRRPSHKLSKGERQRVLLALALLGSPELLVLDEPTDGLDPPGRALVREVLAQECASGRTVFLNSHLLSETERICQRVGILHAGHLVREEVLGRDPALSPHGTSAILLRAPLAPAEAASLELRASDGAKYLRDHANLEELNTTIDSLRARGALLIEVRRERATLEESLAAATAGVAAGPLHQPGDVQEADSPRSSPLRMPLAAARVAREIFSDLYARRSAHVALGATCVLLVLFAWSAHEEVAAGLRGITHMVTDPSSDAMDNAAGGFFAMMSGGVLLAASSFLSGLFAPRVLEPRRAILLQVQPVSRGDIALGLFAAVCGMAWLTFALFFAGLYAVMRYLGVHAPLSFLLVPDALLVGFAALYALTLAATYVAPNALFAACFGLGQFILFAALGDLQAGRLGYAHGVKGFLLGLIPRLGDVANAVKAIGGGTRPSANALVPTMVYTLVVLLILRLMAQRSER